MKDKEILLRIGATLEAAECYQCETRYSIETVSLIYRHDHKLYIKFECIRCGYSTGIAEYELQKSDVISRLFFDKILHLNKCFALKSAKR